MIKKPQKFYCLKYANYLNSLCCVIHINKQCANDKKLTR